VVVAVVAQVKQVNKDKILLVDLAVPAEQQLFAQVHQ
jgi:hypothetical protein